MENTLTDMDLLQKKQYTSPEMKVEVLRPRCNLLENSFPFKIEPVDGIGDGVDLIGSH